jgi:hypothetical protein
MKRTLVALATLPLFALAGCEGDSDADVARQNLSTAAEQFQVNRRIVVINGVTDKYILAVEGRCSTETAASSMPGSIEITCKTGPGLDGKGEFKKYFAGLSDNTTYFVEQLEPMAVDVYHYKVIFKPETLIPDVDMKTSGNQ